MLKFGSGRSLLFYKFYLVSSSGSLRIAKSLHQKSEIYRQIQILFHSPFLIGYFAILNIQIFGAEQIKTQKRILYILNKYMDMTTIVYPMLFLFAVFYSILIQGLAYLTYRPILQGFPWATPTPGNTENALFSNCSYKLTQPCRQELHKPEKPIY